MGDIDDGHFERLAKVFNADVEEMTAQHAKLHPIAKFCATNEHLSSLEAWRRAISLTAGRNKASYQTTHLRRALKAYGAWRTSASGVEQNFNLR